jgi:hypothetical protein
MLQVHIDRTNSGRIQREHQNTAGVEIFVVELVKFKVLPLPWANVRLKLHVGEQPEQAW